MKKKTTKTNKSAAKLQQSCSKVAAELQQICYKSVPLLHKFRGYLRKEVANLPQIWLPIECNLLFRYEFATLSPQTRYIFVAILLYCGARGTDEIPINTAFLANALAVDARLLKKSLEELEKANLLTERKIEREEKKDTDRQKEADDGSVSVDDSSLSKTEDEDQSENSLLKRNFAGSSNGNAKHSQFTIEECLRYAEVCQAKGDAIQNPKALASNLFKTGDADAFILATLYPERAAEAERETFGKPTIFTDEPCAVCFGAKMEVVKDKGARPCQHCKDERGKSTGLEPEGENEQ